MQTYHFVILSLLLQTTFFVLFLSGSLSYLNPVIGFTTCLLLISVSLVSGMKAIRKAYPDSLWLTISSLGAVVTSLFIILFTVYIYLSVEGDGLGPILFQL
ncbi:hypothetical protein [Alkalihalophilus marmarensis]|uniref:Uncharacterized protein n=1 Tax=Alkalihalophilus marmarensis DSM 21297 TaxID=1188261 RepID=U6SSM5_9BACI|nr:hypothetical protein [Alkalihalophilus marmarensis]ERN53656.1 hypothetical protein A33I_10645 [Alkalihalophilus marmarensis DSM 21297]